jgi:ATP-dependent RNA helicase DeaD
LEQFEAETGLPLIDIAAALASLSQGTTPLLLGGKSERPTERGAERPRLPDAEPAVALPAAGSRPADSAPERKSRAKSGTGHMETFRIEVGSVHGIKPGNIVGAIANEAGIEGVHIGRVDIREDYSFVDLPEGMPKQIFTELQQVRVVGRELRISRVYEKPAKPPRDATGRHPTDRDPGGRSPSGRPLMRKKLSPRSAKK